jgi:hypothetical protein
VREQRSDVEGVEAETKVGAIDEADNVVSLLPSLDVSRPTESFVGDLSRRRSALSEKKEMMEEENGRTLTGGETERPISATSRRSEAMPSRSPMILSAGSKEAGIWMTSTPKMPAISTQNWNSSTF